MGFGYPANGSVTCGCPVRAPLKYLGLPGAAAGQLLAVPPAMSMLHGLAVGQLMFQLPSGAALVAALPPSELTTTPPPLMFRSALEPTTKALFTALRSSAMIA